MIHGVRLTQSAGMDADKILSAEALTFVADLHREFNQTREESLRRRAERQREIDAGHLPDFLAETKFVRDGDWKVNTTPHDLQNHLPGQRRA